MSSDAQKGVLPVVVVPCAVVLYVLYRYIMRPLYGNKTFEQRMNYFYTYASAALFGEVMFQAYPNATIPMIVHNTNATVASALSPAIGSSIPSMFFFIGFFVISTFYESLRIWHANPYQITTESNSEDIHYLVDRESNTMNDYFEADNTAPNLDVSEQRSKVEQDNAIAERRRYIAYITILLLSVTCVLEGFFLSYQTGNKWVIIVMFMLDKVMETLVVGVAMANALFHTQGKRYLYGAILWCFVVVSSTIPVLAGMTMQQAAIVVSHMAVGIFYAAAGACLFFICFLYTNIHLKKTDKVETLTRQAIWFLTASVAWVVGYFY